MSGDFLITIGSHSHNHLNLKILSNDEILYEVKKSLGILENLLGHKVKHFSYPYGEKNQDSSQKYNIIENLSFDSAVTAKAYPIKNYNLFSLPRIYVGQNTCEKTIINHLSGFYNLTNKYLICGNYSNWVEQFQTYLISIYWGFLAVYPKKSSLILSLNKFHGFNL